MTEDEALGELIRLLARYTPAEQADVIKSLSETDQRALAENWPSQAHGGQQEPPGEWRTWLVMAGRGFGKTRCGAEWVLARARALPKARIALVGGSIDEVAKVMVEGESGLLASARAHERLPWRSSTGKLKLPNDGLATAYSGANPGRLRGQSRQTENEDETSEQGGSLAVQGHLFLPFSEGRTGRPPLGSRRRDVGQSPAGAEAGRRSARDRHHHAGRDAAPAAPGGRGRNCPDRRANRR